MTSMTPGSTATLSGIIRAYVRSGARTIAQTARAIRPNAKAPAITKSELFQLSWSGAVLIILALAGWAFTASMARYGESIERKNLTTLASTAAASVDGDYVARLHGDSGDVDTATFNHVRADLKRVDNVPNVRFVYLMTERAGKWLFLADAEDPGSKDYSPPGQVYTADTTNFNKVLTTGVPVIDGPSPDDWGVWVSGLAPIRDPQTGKPIAVFGMDISADRWLATVNHYRQVGEAIAALVFALAALFLAGLYRQKRQVETLNAEIAGRRQAEASLELANAVLAAARDSSLDGILVVDPQARIISYNQRFLDLFHVPEELAKAGVDDPLRRHVTASAKDPAAFLARVVHLYKHREESGADRFELVDGRIINRYSAPLSRDGDGYLGRIWFFRDVTEQVAIESAVRRSEEKYRNLVEATTDYIWESDKSGRYTYVSPAARAMLGYQPEEILGKTLFDFMSAEESARVKRELAPIVAAERTFSQFESSILRKDGAPIVIETSGIPIFDPNGVFTGYRGIDRDISARKKAEAATQYRGALLHAVSVVAKDLLTAPSVGTAMATALKVLGEAVHADRVLVFERQTPPAGAPAVRLQYGWNSPQAPVIVDAATIANAPDIQADPWFAPLSKGEAVGAIPKEMPDGAIKSIFVGLGIRSIILVPITAEGSLWGHIGLDDCTTERAWSPAEIDILRTVADMFGAVFARDRYVERLKDANTIVESSPTILFRLGGGPSLPLIYISHNVTMYGYEPAALIASPQIYQTIIHPDDAPKAMESLMQTAMNGSKSVADEFRMRGSDGAYYWVDCRYTPIRDEAGRLVEIEGLLTDRTEQKKAADKISALAMTDALTGLANRAVFIDRMRQAFAAAERGASPFAVLYLDLDRFKDINDTLGHSAGDLLLKSVGERLKSCVRETDLIARLGGDEFAVLQTSLGDVASAAALASKIHDALSAPYPLGDTEMRVTVSIGISPWMPETAGPDELLAQADIALYRAKDDGRDQYCFHTDALTREARERATLANDLSRALEREDGLELYFQPQVELATGLIVGMEALIRWNHPTRGLLEPTDFLPIVEKTPVIVTLGEWVLDHACEQMSEWKQAGIAPSSLAVNLSLKQLQIGEEFIRTLTRTLAKWRLSPKDLELDVTESMLAHVTLHKNGVLERLHQLGVKIAIDDFGTQYSSFDYLKTYSVSRVKIPRPMIYAATQDPEASAMVRAIVGLGRELGIDVVAQGVETEEQRDLLSAAPSPAKVQGYYYSAPVPALDATTLLRQRFVDPRLSHLPRAIGKEAFAQ